jgi:Na+-transporting methylmalonyl-CoA/oxaloacetate decarboxylase beta subunit
MNKIDKIIRTVGIAAGLISLPIMLFPAAIRIAAVVVTNSQLRKDWRQASSIGIIGGADGPTSIFVSGGDGVFCLGGIFGSVCLLSAGRYLTA